MKLSRVGLIGDVHAEAANLEAAPNFLKQAKVERILGVGDIVDGRGDAERCCRLLESFGALAVRGNHDRWLLQNQMRDLPDATSLEELGEAAKLF